MVISAFKKRVAAGAGAVFLLLAVLCFSGCGSMATRKGFYDPIALELQNGNYAAAVQRLEKAKAEGKYDGKDRFLYYADAGFGYHYSSEYDSSISRLTDAENAAEELFTRSISRAALSMILNDNALEYAGEDYEILYTNLFKALNFIAKNDAEGAFVEIRRANEKLNLLEIKYNEAARQFNDGLNTDTAKIRLEYQAKKIRFNNSAFARYLSMHMYAAAGKMDDARIDYDFLQNAFLEQPHIYNHAPPPVQYHSKQGLLSIVGLTGLSPVKEELALRLRTDKDLDLIQVFYTDPERQETEYGHIPAPIGEDYYFKFSIPEIVSRPSSIERIEVLANDRLLGELHLLEDVGRVAQETFEAKKSLIYLRTIARAVTKGLATHKVKKKADTGGLGGWLKKAAIDVASDITENADLRCCRMLPGKIYAADFELPPGIYDLNIRFYGFGGVLLEERLFPQYEVLKNGLNLVEAFCLR
ncbi:MAG: hypothetical protein HRF51_00400 [bacterium]